MQQMKAQQEVASSSSTKKERKKLVKVPPQKLQPQTKNSKEYGKMLESFWKLSEYNGNTRLEGTRDILKYFVKLEATDEAHAYILTRLIKGLASNRKCSRLGYSTCLTELINVSKVEMDRIFELARTNLAIADANAGTGNSLTKEEMRHIQIGRLFVYLAWIQSEKFVNGNEAMVRSIANDLNSTRKGEELKVCGFIHIFIFFKGFVG
jgi:hypothetical protein